MRWKCCQGHDGTQGLGPFESSECNSAHVHSVQHAASRQSCDAPRYSCKRGPTDLRPLPAHTLKQPPHTALERTACSLLLSGLLPCPASLAALQLTTLAVAVLQPLQPAPPARLPVLLLLLMLLLLLSRRALLLLTALCLLHLLVSRLDCCFLHAALAEMSLVCCHELDGPACSPSLERMLRLHLHVCLFAALDWLCSYQPDPSGHVQLLKMSLERCCWHVAAPPLQLPGLKQRTLHRCLPHQPLNLQRRRMQHALMHAWQVSCAWVHLHISCA